MSSFYGRMGRTWMLFSVTSLTCLGLFIVSSWCSWRDLEVLARRCIEERPVEKGSRSRQRCSLWMLPWRYLRTIKQIGAFSSQDSEETSSITSSLLMEDMLSGSDGMTSSSVVKDAKKHLSMSSSNEDTEESEHILNLLHVVAEDLARREGYVHRGVTCNQCRLSPIRGTRYKCANCKDYDLCELCESQEVHLKTHVFLKIRIPIPPLANPRHILLSCFYPGMPSDPRRDSNASLGLNLVSSLATSLPPEDLKEFQRRTHFDRVELEALYEQFKSLCDNPHVGITRTVFEKCLGPLGIERNFITDRIFSFFDQDADGLINFSELVGGLSIVCKGTQEEKMKFAFQGYDLDGDGRISREELHQMLKAYFYLSMNLVRDMVHSIEHERMERFDENATHPISASFTAPIPPSHRRPSSYTMQLAHDNTSQRQLPIRKHDESIPSNPPSATFLEDPGKTEETPYTDSMGLDAASQLDMWPTIEALSQTTIEDMVERSFQMVNAKDQRYLSYEQFKYFVKNDPTVISWVNMLGTIF